MSDKRQKLLEMDKKRKEMEAEINSLTEYLTGPGMPGVTKPLVDEEGYPLPNLDLYAIRTARVKLIYLQNDLKNLMEEIEVNMADYFSDIKKEKEKEKKEEKKEEEEPISVPVPAEDKKASISASQEPFAVVSEVTEGSPAEEAGLKEGDAIVSFDNILRKGVSSNPLQTLARICNEKVNKKIPVMVLRKNSNNVLDVSYLNLIPHTWNGRGILGCKLNLL